MDKIFLTLKDVALRLGVSEKTIYRMLGDNQIPFAVKIGGQWRFRTDALEGWLNRQANLGPEVRQINSDLTVHEALQQGAVLYRIHGRNRDEAIDELLSALPYSSNFNLDAIKLAIFARESLVASSMQGIAYMGISGEQPVFFEKTMVLLAFLEAPMNFKALDGVKTFAVFLVLPANLAEQSIIEAKLRRLSMENEFQEIIAGHLIRKDLLQAIDLLEQRLFSRKKHSATPLP